MTLHNPAREHQQCCSALCILRHVSAQPCKAGSCLGNACCASLNRSSGSAIHSLGALHMVASTLHSPMFTSTDRHKRCTCLGVLEGRNLRMLQHRPCHRRLRLLHQMPYDSATKPALLLLAWHCKTTSSRDQCPCSTTRLMSCLQHREGQEWRGSKVQVYNCAA